MNVLDNTPHKGDRPKSSQTIHVTSLDGLRGVLVIMIIVFHASAFTPGGFVAVDVFFVLSGFLINSLLLEEFIKKKNICFKNFFARRALRLLPAHATLVLICGLVFTLNIDHNSSGHTPSRYFSEALVSILASSNWFMAFVGGEMYYLSHTWSLATEQQFYIIWPGLCYLLLRSGFHLRALLFLLSTGTLILWNWRGFLAFSGIQPHRIYYGLDSHGSGLLVGCALACFVKSRWPHLCGPSQTFKMRTCSILSVLVLSCAACLLKWTNPYALSFGIPVAELQGAILILNSVSGNNGLVNRMLRNGFLVWIGRRSYGIYLWHYPIFLYLRDFGLRWSLVFCLTLIITITVASVSWAFIEAPALRWNKFLR